MGSSKYRVIQWATGNTGQRALREVIRDPKFDLVGVMTFNPDKNGVDAGDLCGEPTTGIKATTNREDLLKLDADCVVYTPRAGGRGISRAGLSLDELVDDIVALTSAGKNIVSTCTDLFAGGSRFEPDQYARIVAACQKSGASIYGSGSSPGILTETMPLPFLAMMRRVDHIELEEYGDLSRRPSPHMVFEQMRFGKPLDEFDPERRRHHLFIEYQPALNVLAEAAEVKIDGDAPVHLKYPFPVPLEKLADYVPAYNANILINAIPYVCAAKPGFLTVEDLPMMFARGPRPAAADEKQLAPTA